MGGGGIWAWSEGGLDRPKVGQVGLHEDLGGGGHGAGSDALVNGLGVLKDAGDAVQEKTAGPLGNRPALADSPAEEAKVRPQVVRLAEEFSEGKVRRLGQVVVHGVPLHPVFRPTAPVAP
jgi:hypothetical protein